MTTHVLSLSQGNKGRTALQQVKRERSQLQVLLVAEVLPPHTHLPVQRALSKPYYSGGLHLRLSSSALLAMLYTLRQCAANLSVSVQPIHTT